MVRDDPRTLPDPELRECSHLTFLTVVTWSSSGSMSSRAPVRGSMPPVY